jgi:Holliday junction resolvase RusA-like endonuclease
MSEPLVFFVPGITVAKGRPRFVRATGRTYTPAKTVTAERGIAQFAAEAMRGRELFSTPVELDIIAAYSPPKTRTRAARSLPWARFRGSRPDIDNIIKGCLDALNGVVWVDDALVASARVTKIYDPHPGLCISVKNLSFMSWPFCTVDDVTGWLEAA